VAKVALLGSWPPLPTAGFRFAPPSPVVAQIARQVERFAQVHPPSERQVGRFAPVSWGESLHPPAWPTLDFRKKTAFFHRKNITSRLFTSLRRAFGTKDAFHSRSRKCCHGLAGHCPLMGSVSWLCGALCSRGPLIVLAVVEFQHMEHGMSSVPWLICQTRLMVHARRSVNKEFAHELSRKGGIGQCAGGFLAPHACRHPLLRGADRGVPLDHFRGLAGNTTPA
jgi:hypothetical protein